MRITLTLDSEEIARSESAYVDFPIEDIQALDPIDFAKRYLVPAVSVLQGIVRFETFQS